MNALKETERPPGDPQAQELRRQSMRTRIMEHKFRQRVVEEFSRIMFKGYKSATRDRPYGFWSPDSGSADEDILNDLPTLRSRTRDLIRTDPHAAGLRRTWVDNIIGWQGLRPQPSLDRETIGLTERQARKFEEGAEKIWKKFTRRCDATGRLPHAFCQRLWASQLFENGDVFKIPRPLGTGLIKFAVQTIEADRVTTPGYLSSNSSIREGVRIGQYGEHLSYFVKKTHPGDTRSQGLTKQDFVEIEVRNKKTGHDNILMLYEILRPDQTRGVPLIGPALDVWKDLQQYIKAEIISAKVAACLALFITTATPYESAVANSELESDGKRREDVEPGIIERLAPGEDIKGFNTERDGGSVDAFVMRMLRALGTSAQMPYEEVSQDYSQTTYTSGRMALTSARSVYRGYQYMIADQYCQPDYARIIDQAVALGLLIAPRYEQYREEYWNALWIGRGWPWVDPQKEGAAVKLLLEENLTTLQDEWAARGADYEDKLRQRAIEEEKKEELGLKKQPLPAAPPAATQPTEPTEEPTDGQQEK